jgi:methylmalonyl-CoA/ethylmalonyl-CoA epimerase
VKQLDFFGPEARFHHIGVAVPSITKAEPDVDAIADPIQKVGVAFLSVNGLTVELVEPHGERSPVQRSLEKGVTLLHLCYEVPDLRASLEHCRGFGFSPLGQPVPAVAFGGRKILWVFSRTYGLFELLEAEGGGAANP